MLIAKNSGGDFTPAPAGTHSAICYQVIDLGMQTGSYAGKITRRRQVLLTFELCEEPMKDGRPFSISKFYTLSLNEKATLRHDLESWRGRPFTAEELDGFDLKRVIGVPCLVTIVHEQNSEGRTRAKINNVAAPMKGMARPAQVNPPVSFDIDEWNDDVYAGLTEFVKKTIMASEEYIVRTAPENGHVPGRDEVPSDDDIPF